MTKKLSTEKHRTIILLEVGSRVSTMIVSRRMTLYMLATAGLGERVRRSWSVACAKRRRAREDPPMSSQPYGVRGGELRARAVSTLEQVGKRSAAPWRRIWSVAPSRRDYSPFVRVISGGQTGADRGGLDAAIDLGLPHGGFCPKGRRAEDGIIPARHVLEETKSADYAERTEQNVNTADATVVFTRGKPTGGSALTVRCAETASKPVLAIDLNASSSFAACRLLDELVERVRPSTLNIAGTRESEASGIAASVREIVRRVLAHTPPCEHLRPIVESIRAAGVPFGPIVAPYADDGTSWFMCDATFDEPALRARLALPDFVRFAEYDGRAAGSDATFTCTRCKQAILGLHPRYAPADARRVC
jgi:predicted Rossmann-fold nucleotide-binding protein